MNLQQYSTIYSSFHGAFEYNVIGDTIVIPIDDVSWQKSIVLKIKNFDKIYNDSKPLAKSLICHYRMETNCTVFTTKDSWSVLLGDQKVVYPKYGGKTLLCATQLFVKNIKAFELYMKSVNAVCVYENTYNYKNAVVYLDNYDIPYPGGKYFDSNNQVNTIYRICFLAFQEDTIIQFENEFKNRKDIWTYPLKLKCAVASISKFIKTETINEVSLSETFYENTNIIFKRKCFQNPNFILQDILESFNKLNEVGIIIEYPICISYIAMNASDSNRKFQAFAINCNVPKTVLYVPSPYDRFYQYRYTPKNIIWTTLLYDTQCPPENMDPVIIDKNIIGYNYNNTFFCHSHPKLLINTHMDNKNTDTILNMLSFDLKQDENFKIVSTYKFDFDHILYCVKHKDCNHELWCLGYAHNLTAYVKRTIPYYLVSSWAQLVIDHIANKETNYGDLNLIKLMYILARHNICFSTRQSRKRDIVYENLKDIVFKIEPNVLEFINKLRLNLNVISEKQEESCIIL